MLLTYVSMTCHFENPSKNNTHTIMPPKLPRIALYATPCVQVVLEEHTNMGIVCALIAGLSVAALVHLQVASGVVVSSTS